MNEAPALSKNYQQWLCPRKDAICACCDASLIAARLSTDRLILDGNNFASLAITNKGLFSLYWAAELISPEPGVPALFSITPDYGIVTPGAEQSIGISFCTRADNREDQRGVRAHLEIASNVLRQGEIKKAERFLQRCAMRLDIAFGSIERRGHHQ